jgi:formylglycine-generating enzyme
MEGCPDGSSCSSNEQPEHQMTLGSFMLDKYEITVGRFRNFVAGYAGGWRPGVGSGVNLNVTAGDTSWQSGWDDSAGAGTNLPATGASAAQTQANFAARLKCSATWQTWTDTAGADENKAINCVNWYEAFAFCIWDGGRLPTEAEWEYAATGGEQNLIYPWGSAVPDCTYANFYNGSYCSGGSGSVVAVGSTPKGNGRWGHADLAGNVWEWNLDWDGGYSTAHGSNYANTTPGSVRVPRGGDFSFVAFALRAAHRYYYGAPTCRSFGVGLRCARVAP